MGVSRRHNAGRLAQPARALALHARGHWFKSSIAHQRQDPGRERPDGKVLGAVAQLVRVPDCRSGSWGFESPRPRQNARGSGGSRDRFFVHAEQSGAGWPPPPSPRAVPLGDSLTCVACGVRQSPCGWLGETRSGPGLSVAPISMRHRQSPSACRKNDRTRTREA